MRFPKHALTASLGAALALALLTACARPDYQYASQQPGAVPAGTVYFKVPDSWTQLTPAQITAAERGWSTSSDLAALLDATSWQAAYDAAATPSLVHVLGRAVPEQPTVYASLRSLYPQEQTGLTTDALKDMVVPLSTLGASVQVTTDTALTQGRATGVHLVFSYSPGAGLPEETIDQTSYLSDGKDAVYLLVVRCTTTCYDAHRDQIAAVTSSYTIQEGRSG